MILKYLTYYYGIFMKFPFQWSCPSGLDVRSHWEQRFVA